MSEELGLLDIAEKILKQIALLRKDIKRIEKRLESSFSIYSKKA